MLYNSSDFAKYLIIYQHAICPYPTENELIDYFAKHMQGERERERELVSGKTQAHHSYGMSKNGKSTITIAYLLLSLF